MFFCIPIIFGCPTKIKPEGGEAPRFQCPHCKNVAVIRAKRTKWFELFWVPLVPFHWKHIWICTICNWCQEVQKGQDPEIAVGSAGAQGAVSATPQAYKEQARPGYQPVYIGQKGQNEVIPKA